MSNSAAKKKLKKVDSSATASHRPPKTQVQRASREELQPLAIRGLTSIDHLTQLARTGWLIEASTTGFLLEVPRKEIIPKKFRESLSLQELEGDKVYLLIDAMNLEVGGVVRRTERKSKDTWLIGVDFRDDAPDYWRECLMDLLPK